MTLRFKDVYDKDGINYGDSSMQQIYITERMAKSEKLARYMMKLSIERSLAQLSSRQDTLQVLSLGCGPGSDILAVIKIIKSVGRRRHLVNISAVDQFAWPMEAFDGKFRRAIENCSIQFLFDGSMPIVSDMESCSWLDQSTDFDLIILSFANAKYKLDFIGNQLKQKLSSQGAIIVVDNNVRGVRDLKSQYGFRQERLLKGKTTCLVYRASCGASREI